MLTAWNTAQQQSQNIFLEQSGSQKLLETLRNSPHKTYFWSSINPKSYATAQLLRWKQLGKKKACLSKRPSSDCLIHFFHCYCFLLTACCLLLEILRNSSLQTFFWSSLKLRSCATAQLLLWKQYGPEKRFELKGWVVLTAWNTAQQQSQNIFLKQSESQKLLERLRNSPHKTFF